MNRHLIHWGRNEKSMKGKKEEGGEGKGEWLVNSSDASPAT